MTASGEAPVAVTGAAGFIGSWLSLELARRGCSVTGIDARVAPAALERAGVALIQADLRRGLPTLPAGTRTLFHLASAHLQATAPDRLFREVNVDAAVAVVRAAAAAGVTRVVHASTVGIYGHVQDPPAREDAPVSPGNAYERTKLEGERAMVATAAECGVEIVVLRPAWVYGAGCPRTAKLLRSIRAGRFFYAGRGENLRHPIHVSDTVEAFIAAGAGGAHLSGQAFNIAGPRYLPLHEMVETCAHVLGVRPPRLMLPRSVVYAAGLAAEIAGRVAGREPPFSRRSLVFFENDNAFDTTAARTAFGFTANVDLEEGLRRTIAGDEAAAAVEPVQ